MAETAKDMVKWLARGGPTVGQYGRGECDCCDRPFVKKDDFHFYCSKKCKKQGAAIRKADRSLRYGPPMTAEEIKAMVLRGAYMGIGYYEGLKQAETLSNN